MTKITITKDAMAKLAAMTTTTGSMTMTDDLVERLLDWPYQGETMAHEAADRIEQLTAELADAEALIEAQAKDHASNNIRFAEAEQRAKVAEAERDRAFRQRDVAVAFGALCLDKMAALELERDRLREALESLHGFADGWRECGCGESCYGRHAERNMVLDHLHDFAAAALKGETP